ncbi:geraniol 8-hydroxylase-like [Pyrus ussuriensis x Pyrus communis]|uniref:Geraniol 8-hydroxylase-like n=1 Tax=Pyrus ussuriensis x Pyrus communis TaxID=2448454 RepID=A0A5N5H3N8_9ROSA|nr:geraniol 8-hydroxylase-like [Pyrus ussuriensis x Pyrus communis]
MASGSHSGYLYSQCSQSDQTLLTFISAIFLIFLTPLLLHWPGPIFKLRLGSTVGVVVTSPSSARQILKEHGATFANRDWRMLRKVCVLTMLSNTTLDSVYALRRKQLRQTFGHFYDRIGSWVNVGEAGLGAEFREVVSKMTELLGKPNVSDFYPGLAWFDLQGVVKRMGGLVRRFDGIFEKVIYQRLRIDKEGEKEESNKDFLTCLLKLKEEGGDSKTPFTMTHLKALLMDIVVGGTDISSNTTEFALAEIMNKPEMMEKAQQELEDVVGKHNIVEESHINKLPYLQVVMKETLRLHLILPLLIPRCPSETCIVGGYTIPIGSWIFKTRLEFKPERFLDSKWGYNGKGFNYFPFGLGKSICARIAMAERMVMHSLAKLLHSFDWKLQEREELDLSEKFGIVLKKKIPLVAILTPRLSDPALYE